MATKYEDIRVGGERSLGRGDYFDDIGDCSVRVKLVGIAGVSHSARHGAGSGLGEWTG